MTLLRYTGNFLLLLGQYYILYNNTDIGIIIKLIGGGLLIGSLVKYKMWDMVIVLTAFMVLDLSRLISDWLKVTNS